MKIPKGFSLPEEHYVISETDIVEILIAYTIKTMNGLYISLNH